MKGYLKIFDTVSEYNDFKGSTGFVLPNVSVCTEGNTIFYNPVVDYVEIGGVKWATMNLGAAAVTDPGLYYQWGDTQGYTADQVGSGTGKKYFGWEDYKYCSGAGTSSSAMTKYNATDGKTVLEATDDAATVNWGNGWRMPTRDEFATLGSAVTTAWTSDYKGTGVSGMVCTDNTDSTKTLFFPVLTPASGGVITTSVVAYWNSTLSSTKENAYTMQFTKTSCSWKNVSAPRHTGRAIRPVKA